MTFVDQHVTILVTAAESGIRLDQLLAARFGGLSRVRLGNLIASGATRVNRSAARPGLRVGEGDLVEVTVDQEWRTSMAPEHLPLKIIHEDEALLVVEKPANMLVHPTRGVKTGTLANALTYYLNRDYYQARLVFQTGPDAETKSELPQLPGVELQPMGFQTPAHGETHSLIRPGIVHRLDRATSGLLIVAKTQRALRILSKHFRRSLVVKKYLAVVHSRVEQDEGTIVAPIGREPERVPKWGVSADGKNAETRFFVRGRRAGLTLLELEPITGRTNQLRIHCAHAGHPIVGDDLFGLNPEPNRLAGSQPRLCLHAHHLAFHHPDDGEWLELDSPIPSEISRVFEG